MEGERFSRGGADKAPFGGAEAVSFDVYDTLVARPFVRPTDLFGHMESVFERPGFESARVEAERSARRSSQREDVTLDEIYAHLGEGYADLMEAETALERSAPAAMPGVKALFDSARESGLTVVATSDMYLPEGLIAGMLADRGISPDRLYVSSAVGLTKHTGSLYRHVSEDLGIEPPRILHVGDNRRADGDNARSAGMRAMPVEKPIDSYFRSNSEARAYYRRSPNAERSVVVGMDMLDALAYSGEGWVDLGRRYGGPLASGYARFVQGALRPSAAPLFASRDGYNLMAVRERLYPGCAPARYVHAQRLLSDVLTEDKLPYGPVELPDMKSQPYESRRTSFQVSEVLGFFREELGEYPGDPEGMAEFYNSHIGEIDALRRSGAEDYASYVRATVGEGDADLVDSTTMRFTSQRLVSRMLGRPVNGVYFVTLEDDPSLEYASYHRKQGLMLGWRRVNLAEFLLCSPELPLDGWRGGAPVRMRDPPECEARRAEYYQQVTDGEADYAGELRARFGDALPRLSYETVIGWALTSAVAGTWSRRLLDGVEWASGPNHSDWMPLIPGPRDLPALLRKYASDLVAKLNRRRGAARPRGTSCR